MNDLVKFGSGNTLPASPDDLVKGLQNVGQNLHAGSGGMPYLRLIKAGVFVYGQENIEIEEGSEWAINPYSLQHGFAAWGDGELFDEIMVPFNQQPPAVGTLQDYGVAWNSQVAMQLQCLNGEDVGVNVLYKGTSKGLLGAMKHLIDSLITQIGSDKTHIVPVVTLEVDSYKHKKYGEIYTPVINIERWISIEDGESAEAEPEGEDTKAVEQTPAEDAKAPEAAAAPTRRRRGKTDPKDDGGGDNTPAPTRRRRRAA